MIKLRDRLLTSREAAEMLGWSYPYFRQRYLDLMRHGVIPVKICDNGHPKFRESELLKLIDDSRVVKDGRY